MTFVLTSILIMIAGALAGVAIGYGGAKRRWPTARTVAVSGAVGTVAGITIWMLR